MPDDLYAKPQDSLRLDPPIAVPEPAPLDMPRRPIRLLPFALPRLALRPTLIGRSPERSGTGCPGRAAAPGDQLPMSHRVSGGHTPGSIATPRSAPPRTAFSTASLATSTP